MGIEGAVLAVGALFLLAYVVPHLTRKRAVLADAPIGERFSADLRLITERTVMQVDGEHGKIFTTERIMNTPSKPSGSKGPDSAKMRMIARDRSRARARIAQRGAYQQRSLLGGIVLVALTVAAWIVAGVSAMPVGIAIASTAVGGLYLLGVGYLVSTWNRLNTEDEKLISKANHALRAGKKYQKSLSTRTKTAETISPTDISSAPAHDGVIEHDQTEATPEENATERLQAKEKQLRHARTAQPTPRTRPQAEAPSYTLKPTVTRRQVKPYVAPEAPETDVPFRPTQVGQRIGHEPLQTAHTAPEMSGNEELRSDVLGGGSTLDALLDRRRA